MSKKAIHTSGKRKRAIARATLTSGKGIVKVNNKLLEVYEPRMARLRIQEPLILSGAKSKDVNISVTVRGGGVATQADAVRLAIVKHYQNIIIH